MKIVKIDEVKAEKDGRITPEYLAKKLYESVDSVKEAIIVTVTKEGVVNIAYSDISLLRGIGLLEVAKRELIDEMWEPL